ncbi:MAG TPA: DUF1800 domain-containing protein [Blastocatellia bacterium]|jgi:uncharacterized protein (DUF1800 family)|nr:DUF1800 domain-containing protein [Blastocatellia bacterium]
MKQGTINSPTKITIGKRRGASAVIALAIVATFALEAIMPAFADAKSKMAGRGLSEDQKIVHLLNRIGFGPRPGDVERVKRVGVDKFIDQQLHPERLDDSAAEARLKGLGSLNMSIAEIYEKYPAPNMLARELGLGKKGFNQQPKPGGGAAGTGAQEQPEARADDLAAELAKKENRQKIFAYYREHDLKPPQALLQELTEQKILRAVYSERQLQEVMADFWFNHFNIFYGKGADKWLTTDYEMNAIRPHTLGKFGDLLAATAKSPAMLFYLDNFQSSSPDAKPPERRGNGRGGQFQGRPGPLGGGLGAPRFGNRQRRIGPEVGRDAMGDGRQTRDEQQRGAQAAQQFKKRKPGINENYARELMELHTLGVEGGYTQRDVQEVARCFTGWTINQPRRSGEFVFREWMHDDGEKVVLGHKIPAGGGKKDGEMVLDILARHPNTAKFISTKLVRRFVSDNPPQSLVERVAGVYLKSDGDIREMLRAIFTAPEFNSQEAYRAKIKSPFELAVSAIRALGGEAANTQQVAQFISRMGQPLYRYQPPTGFPDRAEQWVNTGSLLERLNFGLALSTNRLRGTTVDLKRVAPGVQGASTDLALDRAIALLLNGDVSQQTRATLEKQLREGVPTAGELGGSPRASMKSDGMDEGDSLLADDSMSARRQPKGDKVAKYNDPGRKARKMGLAYDAGAQATASSSDPEIAKVFGLVLGSPEFQRR